MFGPEHLKRLQTHAIGKQKIAAADGVEVGWTAGDHLLDTSFDLEKNIVNDTLHFCLRIDTIRLPSDLLKRVRRRSSCKALAAGNPSGIPSARQKREARELAREKLEEEAARRPLPQAQGLPALVGRPVQRAARRHHVGDGARSIAHAV